MGHKIKSLAAEEAKAALCSFTRAAPLAKKNGQSDRERNSSLL
jgi:hypothetical protein